MALYSELMYAGPDIRGQTFETPAFAHILEWERLQDERRREAQRLEAARIIMDRRARERRQAALAFVGTEQRQVERRTVFGRRLNRDRSVA